MIMADSFCRSGKARDNEFTTNLEDAPVIAQFAANTVQDFVGAAHMVSPYCNGVDLNCGCPQTWAKQLGIGCAMLNHPEVISDLVRQCRNQILKPFTVSVKVRVLKDVRRTIETCRQLEKAGISFLAVHARTPSQSVGTIDTNTLKLIVENVHCPVIGNGGVKTLDDCLNLQKESSCNGVMVANGLLTNPTLFTGTESTPLECVQKWLDICFNSTLGDNLCNQLTIPERPPNLTFQCFHHHLVFMLEKLLTKSKRRIFNSLQHFDDVLRFLQYHLDLKPQVYGGNMFKKRQILNLDYNGRDSVYNKLKLPYQTVTELAKVEYSYDNDGTFFKSKLVEDDSIEFGLENIFI
ncbi:tRNA-dihydrouridine(20a/20b) synthase [NAD(P)+]-like isoform X2 [Photinus pyralis]|nr:tRNA-dihydrouridine(20a/20b) synthase [NAD(P)+]-like isoform X2 [Photinus pyralis]